MRRKNRTKINVGSTKRLLHCCSTVEGILEILLELVGLRDAGQICCRFGEEAGYDEIGEAVEER